MEGIPYASKFTVSADGRSSRLIIGPAKNFYPTLAYSAGADGPGDARTQPVAVRTDWRPGDTGNSGRAFGVRG